MSSLANRTGQLAPWRTVPKVSCDYCADQATYRLHGLREDRDAHGDHALSAVDDGERMGLACEAHHILMLTPGSGVGPIKLRWHQWLWDLRAPAKWLRRNITQR